MIPFCEEGRREIYQRTIGALVEPVDECQQAAIVRLSDGPTVVRSDLK